MRLKALIEDLKEKEILGHMREDIEVNSVTNDSRKVKCLISKMLNKALPRRL